MRDHNGNDGSPQVSHHRRAQNTFLAAVARRHSRPAVLNMVDKDRVDKAGGHTMFGIDSHAKHLINLAC